jgi:hypothetical protein
LPRTDWLLQQPPPLEASEAAGPAGPAADEEDYSDMPPLIPIDASFRASEDDYSDMPGLISLEELHRQQEEQEEHVASPQLPQSLIDTVGGSVEALFNLALRPVSVPVWGIALAVAILPTLLMSKC